MVNTIGATKTGGGTQILSAGVRRTIQTIKEIVGNHSDADIYFALKDSNMDPNETTQKLLNQDPFHEVKRRRDKKKEIPSISYKRPTDPVRNTENFIPMIKDRPFVNRNGRRGGYNRNPLPGNREFRVVRDNRVNQNINNEMKPPSLQSSPSNKDKVAADVEKGSTGISRNQKSFGGRSFFQASNGPADSQPIRARDVTINSTDRKEVSERNQTAGQSTVSRVQAVKPNSSQAHSETVAPSNSVVGVYFSSTDPVHVPSPDSRSPAPVGAIKREVGVVGGRRLSTENTLKESSAPSNSFSNSLLGRDNTSESFQPFPAISKADQPNQTAANESGMPSMPARRELSTNHYSSSRSSQHAVGHQRASQQNKEWKPKSSTKSGCIGPGVIGTPTKSTSPPADNSKDLESDVTNLQDKVSQVNIQESQNVIIAEHIRVPETDRCRLTFGSFSVDFDSSQNFRSGFQAIGAAELSNGDLSASLSGSSPEFSGIDAPSGKPVDIPDDQVRNSDSNSPASVETAEHQLPDDIKETSSSPNLENYANIGLVRDDNPSYGIPESQQHQHPPELTNFAQAYDSQASYDMPYFRPGMDQALRGQGLPTPPEALTSHTNIPASTMTMVQQQQQQQQQTQMAQMYPQVHMSTFPNLMPYRQILSPVYVPQMAMPGYSSNPAYPHPTNGSSYLLMPGGSSHLGANGLKYGIQQFKPVPANSPSGFGSFTSPSGYAINAPSVVGSANGLEDSSRLKYKDGNLYVANPQAETSEVWIQNPRELPGMQSAAYYNMPTQTPHAAYLPSHAGHASFNAAAAQSSHMQFPGMYHPTPQPAAMANPHHLGPSIGGNVGVGVPPTAPGPQVGAYQQPQMGNFNWTPNF